MKTKTQKALKTLTKALTKDPDFFSAWQKSIAIQFIHDYSRKKREKNWRYINNAEFDMLAYNSAAAFLRNLITKIKHTKIY